MLRISFPDLEQRVSTLEATVAQVIARLDRIEASQA